MSERLDPALIAMRRILRATEIGSRALAKRCGLTPSQLILMQTILNSENDSADRNSTRTPSRLARQMSLSQATVTALLDKLEKRELVKRHRDQSDKRRVYIDLTAAGRAILRDAPDSLQERFEERFNRLAAWEQSFLVAALERTATLLDAESLDAAPVLDVGAIDTLTE